MMVHTYAGATFPWAATRQPPLDDQALDAWVKRELGRAFDNTLCETLPQDLLDLLRDIPPAHH
jgi:hypothetical protein